LPVTRWLGRSIRPSFLVSICSRSPGRVVLVTVHGLKGLQVTWGFGDFRSLKTSPD